MARYRTYKNGITGHRYKGYYIIRGEGKGKFSIWDESKIVRWDEIYDYDECEWIIDKDKASEEETVIIKQLYEKEIYQLSEMFITLMQMKDGNGLDEESKKLYNWVEKIRKRKAEDRIY